MKKVFISRGDKPLSDAKSVFENKENIMSNMPPDVQKMFVLPSVNQQLQRLRELFPHLKYVKTPRIRASSATASTDGELVVMQFEKVNPKYFQALGVVISMIRNLRKVTIDMECDGKLDVKKFRRLGGTTSAMQCCFNESGVGLAIVPVQFTRRFVDKNPDRNCDYFEKKEFPLDLFSVGVSLLTCDSVWELSRSHAIVAGGDRYDDTHLHYVFGGTVSSWNRHGYELSPCVFEEKEESSLVFPTGFHP